jgi:hypothetical protein
MCGGARIGDDMTNEGKITNKWVRNLAEPMPTFYPQ